MTKIIEKKLNKTYRSTKENPLVSRFTIKADEKDNLVQIFSAKAQDYGRVFYRTRSRSKA